MTLWVLVVVPVLLSMMLGAVLLLPKLATSAWDSGHAIGSGLPHDAAHGHIVALLSGILRLIALFLPVCGSVLVSQRVLRMLARKGMGWSAGRPMRRTAVVAVAAAASCGAAWAWWPAGQYQAVRPTDAGTLGGVSQLVSTRVSPAPTSAAPAPVHLAPGRHLAVAMIPVDGATKRHPALFVIPSSHGDPAVAIVSDSAPDPTSSGSTAPTTDASAFPFTLPSSPPSGSSKPTSAATTTTTKGGVTYDVGYALVVVSGGAPVTSQNVASVHATCNACTTVAVSFQLVLVVGESKVIAPIDVADAKNTNCPACVTVAIADQMVVTLTAQPSQELVAKLDAALKQLDAISALGANGTPAAVAAQVQAVQQEVTTELNSSGLLAKPIETSTSTTATTPTPAPTSSTATTTTSTTPAATTPSQTTSTPTTTSTAATPASTTTEQTTTTDTTPTTTDEDTTTTTTDTTPTTTSSGQ